jgi:hydrogenase maturation protease
VHFLLNAYGAGELSLSDTLVLGLGNPLRGDDGVGPAVIAELQRREVPAGVTLMDGGTAGLATPLLWDGYRHVIVVDAAAFAAEAGLAPGGWRRLLPAEMALTSEAGRFAGTLHGAGLTEALALAGQLGLMPPRLVLYAVQVAPPSWGEGLSPEVAAAVAGVCDAILGELSKNA